MVSEIRCTQCGKGTQTHFVLTEQEKEENLCLACATLQDLSRFEAKRILRSLFQRYESQPLYGTIGTVPVGEYGHLPASMRSSWIACVVCGQVPEDLLYQVSYRGSGGTFCSEGCARLWIGAQPPMRPVASRDDRLPTQVIQSRDVWIDATRELGLYPADLATRSGKWMVWVKSDVADFAWVGVRDATRGGKLGGWAKVATSASSKTQQSGEHVLCVYTYDYEDTADVMRVRQALRDLGFRQRIPYKRNSDTDQLRYGDNYQPVFRA